uniref:Lipocalin/cytosolic fatty-acid binding domain-containing protein n=1 Tax=Loxodonta africana TaxID=9785 RepID=G3UBU7_LOXAF
MKILLLTLAFAVLCASEISMFPKQFAKFSGNWLLLYIASNNTEKMSENSPLVIYVRSIDFDSDGKNITAKVYNKYNGQCLPVTSTGVRTQGNFFTADYAGVNHFQIVYVTGKAVIVKKTNVDEDGVVSKFIALLGRTNTVSDLVFEEFKKWTRKEGIPEENIVNVFSKDDCPVT